MQYIGLYAKTCHYLKVCLAVSKDQLIKKFPEQKEAIEFFFQRAPNGNPKYIEWELKVLATRQAMKEEIADVIALFDKFRNRLQKKDIFQYQPGEFTSLRDQLFALRDEQAGKKDERQKKVEKRYQNEPEAIACGHKVIFDSEDLKCIQITNKAASMHYGMGTKWCITMKDQSYFEDNDKSNVVFFFLFNKHLNKDNKYYKVAFAYQRGTNNEILQVDNFDAEDNQFDSAQLANKYDNADFEKNSGNEDSKYKKYMQELSKIYSMMLEIAKSYPKSLLARIYSNEVPVDEVVKLYQNEQNNDIREALEKYLISKKNDIDVSIIKGIALTTKNKETIDDLASGSALPVVLDALVENLLQSSDMWGLSQVARNNALSAQSIEKIFASVDPNGRAQGEAHYDIVPMLLRRSNCPHARLIQYSKSRSDYFRKQVAENPNAPTEAIDHIIAVGERNAPGHDNNGPSPSYIQALRHPNISPHLLEEALGAHPDRGLAMPGLEILHNPKASPELIEKIFRLWKHISHEEMNSDYFLRSQRGWITAFLNNKNTPLNALEYIYSRIKDRNMSSDFRILNMMVDHPNATPKLQKAIKEKFGVQTKAEMFNAPFGENLWGKPQ